MLNKVYPEKPKPGTDPINVAKAIRRAVVAKSPPARITVGNEALALPLLSRLPPVLIDWILYNFSFE